MHCLEFPNIKLQPSNSFKKVSVHETFQLQVLSAYVEESAIEKLENAIYSARHSNINQKFMNTRNQSLIINCKHELARHIPVYQLQPSIAEGEKKEGF